MSRERVKVKIFRKYETFIEYIQIVTDFILEISSRSKFVDVLVSQKSYTEYYMKFFNAVLIKSINNIQRRALD